jgi:hypothetical protein
MLFERARWPANVSPDVADAPCWGVWSLVTPGVMIENEMKFRPLMGRLSICRCETTVATAVLLASTTGDSAITVTDSSVPDTRSVMSKAMEVPRLTTIPSSRYGSNPDSSATRV